MTQIAPRIMLDLSVEYRKNYARQHDRGLLKNLSITGAFLEHPNPELRPQDKVNLVFNVSGRTRKVSAQVVWTKPGGSGIQFMPDNNRDIQIVDDLMYFVRNHKASHRNVLDDIFEKVG